MACLGAAPLKGRRQREKCRTSMVSAGFEKPCAAVFPTFRANRKYGCPNSPIDLRRSHILRMTLIVEKNELFRPVDVGLIRAIAVIPSTQSLTHLSEELGLLLRQKIYKCSHILSRVKALFFQDRLHSCTKIDRGSANSAHSLGCSPEDCYVIDG